PWITPSTDSYVSSTSRDGNGFPRIPLRRSTPVQEAVKNTHTEPERVHRNPLVDAVEHAGEVQVGREPQRGEPEPADAEPAERLQVGATRHHVRHDPAAGVLGLQRL